MDATNNFENGCKAQESDYKYIIEKGYSSLISCGNW